MWGVEGDFWRSRGIYAPIYCQKRPSIKICRQVSLLPVREFELPMQSWFRLAESDLARPVTMLLVHPGQGGRTRKKRRRYASLCYSFRRYRAAGGQDKTRAVLGG